MYTATGHMAQITPRNITMARIMFQPDGITVSAAMPTRNTIDFDDRHQHHIDDKNGHFESSNATGPQGIAVADPDACASTARPRVRAGSQRTRVSA